MAEGNPQECPEERRNVLRKAGSPFSKVGSEHCISMTVTRKREKVGKQLPRIVTKAEGRSWEVNELIYKIFIYFFLTDFVVFKVFYI